MLHLWSVSVQRKHDTTTDWKEPPYGKVYAWILDQDLTFMELRTVIALLAYADPRRPGKKVWPSGRTLAADIGLLANHNGQAQVSKTLRSLAERGWIDHLRKPGGGTLIGLRMLLTGASWWCEACGRFGHMVGCAVGRTGQQKLRAVGLAGQHQLASQANSTEQTREQTIKTDNRPAGTARPTAHGRPSVFAHKAPGATANGRTATADHPRLAEMTEAMAAAKTLGGSEAGFITATAQRHDLTPSQILASVTALSTRYPHGTGLNNADAKLRDWINREAPAKAAEARTGGTGTLNRDGRVNW